MGMKLIDGVNGTKTFPKPTFFCVLVVGLALF